MSVLYIKFIIIGDMENLMEKEILLQYSCLGNPMDRGAWGASWVKESDTI